MDTQPEVWLRGPVPGVAPALMPAAHAFLQAMEDVASAVAPLTHEQLWEMPGGAASVGFHMLHMAGSTDRLLTYARGERLSAQQREALAGEKNPVSRPASELLDGLRHTIDAALAQLRAVPAEALFDPRTVGRAALPSTQFGLLFHAAEHAQRHTGQIVTTAKIVAGLR